MRYCINCLRCSIYPVRHGHNTLRDMVIGHWSLVIGHNNFRQYYVRDGEMLCESVDMLCQYIVRNGKIKPCDMVTTLFEMVIILSGSKRWYLKNEWSQFPTRCSQFYTKWLKFRAKSLKFRARWLEFLVRWLIFCARESKCYVKRVKSPAMVRIDQNAVGGGQNNMREGQNAVWWFKMVKMMYETLKIL